MNKIYLTRRNLLVLLSKLDRAAQGEETHRTILKVDTTHPKYPCTNETAIVAVEDTDYYVDREAGEMYPTDVPKDCP